MKDYYNRIISTYGIIISDAGIDIQSNRYSDKLATAMDYMAKFKSIVSKKLPSERYNGILICANVSINLKSTSQDIENCLVIYRFQFRFHSQNFNMSNLFPFHFPIQIKYIKYSILFLELSVRSGNC